MLRTIITVKRVSAAGFFFLIAVDLGRFSARIVFGVDEYNANG